MSYKVVNSGSVHIGRAYVLRVGLQTLVYSGNVARLTKRIKADIYRHAFSMVRPGVDARELDNDNIAADRFGHSPFCRWDELEFHEFMLTGEGEDFGDKKQGFSYSHKMGSGEWSRVNTTFYTIK